MNKNKKNLLSIGQVANLKGISVKSLRYYEKLGILIPAYINEKTGYRYYKIEQMIIIDLIVNCIKLGIPLKNFNHSYKKNDSFNVKKILEDGINIIMAKKLELDKSLRNLNCINSNINANQKIKKYTSLYKNLYKERFFITCKWSGDVNNLKEFIKKITDLYNQCEDLDLKSKFNQGIIIINENSTIKKMVFLEISKNTKYIENLIVIPKGEFTCEIFDYDETSIIENKYLEKLIPSKEGIYIFRELYNNYASYNPTPIEVQVYIKGANK